MSVTTATAPVLPDSLRSEQWPATPLPGSFPEFANDPLGFFERLRDEHGDVVDWRFGRARCLFLTRPEDIHEMLAGLGDAFLGDRHPFAFRMMLGEGLLTGGGERHREAGVVQPSMRSRQVRSYAETMTRCAEEFTAEWPDGGRVDVRREMMALTQRIAVRTVFGPETEGREAELGSALRTAQYAIAAESYGLDDVLPDWGPTPGRRRLRDAAERTGAEVARVARAHRMAPDARNDLLSCLLRAYQEQGLALSERKAREAAVSLYFAGHEATSTTLAWAWYLLSRNPEARQRLTGELDSVLGGRAPGYADFSELPYTRQVVKETLRLFPPAWAARATATRHCVLAGRAVAPGTEVWISPWCTHRDPRWFCDADSFIPERWDEELNSLVPHHAWHPFGLDPRTCPGARLVEVAAGMVLATVGRRLHFEVDSGVVAPLPMLTLQPGRGLAATVVRR